jgi:hypothetical protein
MEDQIRDLLKKAKVKEALQLLVTLNPEAQVLLTKFLDADKKHKLGILDYDDYSKKLAEVTYGALEYLPQTPSAPPPPPPSHSSSSGATVTIPVPPLPKVGKTKVFISYNHGDKEVARKVCTFLESNDLDVILDQDDMAAGRSILEFIQDSIKTCDVVLSIVSSKSLQSGWVGQESVASMYAVWLADKKFLPVSLDTVVFDSKFQITALRTINEKIQALDKDIAEIRSLGSDARDLEDDRKRLFDLQKEFSTIIQRLKSVLMIPIDGDNFDGGMKKVLAAIKNM